MSDNPFVERKILRNLPTLVNYLDPSVQFYAPIQVEIDLTNQCTSDCPWCAGFLERKWSDFTLFGTGEDSRSNSVDGVLALLNELAGIGVKAMTWTGGGDPTCHKDFSLFLQKSAELGMQNGLITNGVIPVDHVLQYCEWVRFSVDAATPGMYAKQHGREHHFSRVFENIRKCVAVNLVDALGITIGVGFVTSKDTQSEILEFTRLWKDIFVDYIQYRPLLDTHGTSWFTDDQITLDLIREAKLLDPRVVSSEVKYRAMVEKRPGQTLHCHGTYLEAVVAADGNVYVCCHLKGNPKYSLGSLYERSFVEIWQSHIDSRVKGFNVNSDCPHYCRHFGTNSLVELEILTPKVHENFI